MGAQLETFGIAMPLPIAALKAQLAAADIVNDDEEAAARRVSIALVASAANEALRAAGESARLYQFREDLADWESDEPVWMLLLPEERNQLVADGALRPLDGGTTDALL